MKTRLILEATQRISGKVVAHSIVEEGLLGLSAINLIDMFRKEISVARQHGATDMSVKDDMFTCICQGKECNVTLNRVAV